ncbi:hypothetical protein Celaphus_00009599 [Cervus elaphus hippelaphus]|uniref:Uncharacterized protein n=1 Tax=Cervus elaphus hippelaphus TaxID=46360 RepID=A0A212C046_CEREH|nr:hypothetical protein Celaphus_00009599 [Cervus elaphus hippelaphus]
MQTKQCTLAVHIRHLQWEDMSSRELLEQRLGMNPTQIQALLWDGDQLGHRVITGNWVVLVCFLLNQLVGVVRARVSSEGQRGYLSWEMVARGLVDVGDTLLCPENLGLIKVEELENQALLPNLQQNYLTALAGPHWLLQPVLGRARKDIFQVDILKHLIPFGWEACPGWAVEGKDKLLDVVLEGAWLLLWLRVPFPPPSQPLQRWWKELGPLQLTLSRYSRTLNLLVSAQAQGAHKNS